MNLANPLSEDDIIVIHNDVDVPNITGLTWKAQLMRARIREFAKDGYLVRNHPAIAGYKIDSEMNLLNKKGMRVINVKDTPAAYRCLVADYCTLYDDYYQMGE